MKRYRMFYRSCGDPTWCSVDFNAYPGTEFAVGHGWMFDHNFSAEDTETYIGELGAQSPIVKILPDGAGIDRCNFTTD
jgi:hypothetical protein